MGHPIELSHSGKRSEGKWLMIRREGASLRIFPRRDLHYGILSAFPQDWPAVRFQAVYELAQVARGDRPEDDWERVHESDLERERQTWRS